MGSCNLYWWQGGKALLSPGVLRQEDRYIFFFPPPAGVNQQTRVDLHQRSIWSRAALCRGPPTPSFWHWFSTISKGRVPPTALRTTLPPAPWLFLDVSQWRINQVQPPEMEAWRSFHDRGRQRPQTVWFFGLVLLGFFCFTNAEVHSLK